MSLKRDFNDLKRFNQVVSTLLDYEFEFFLYKIKILSKSKKEIMPGTEPEVIRKILEDLGGTFVKLGQLLSIRPDLIPIRYSQEFSKLQDSVKPFLLTDAKKLIEKESDKKISAIFKNFPKSTIASASIGQVYKANLKNGKSVAIKLQRPKIRKIMEEDLDILEFFAHQMKKHLGMKIIDPEMIVKELRDYTEDELDYRIEVRRLEKFHLLFKGSEIRAPFVYKELCSEKLIVMEYLKGRKLQDIINSNAKTDERKRISDILINAYFKQIFVDGIFHADPHPGNIIILDKKYEEKIGLIDFGIVGEISQEMKDNLLKMFLAMLNKDVGSMIDAMTNLHLVDTNNNEMRRDMSDLLAPYYNASLKEVNFPKLFIQSLKVARKHNLSVPKDYVLLGKALMTIESVCANLYPEFNLAESAKPFVTHLMIEKYSPERLIRAGATKTLTAVKYFHRIPKMVSQYFESETRQDEYLKKISENINIVDKRIDEISERFFLLAGGVVMIAVSFYFQTQPPYSGGFSIPSLISLLLGIAFFVSMFGLKKKLRN